MFLILCIYIVSFLFALYKVCAKETDKVLLFFVFGLPVYFTALSIAFSYGLELFIPMLQSFKEIIVMLSLCILLFTQKRKPLLHRIDYLMLSFLAITLLYTIIPLGEYGLKQKLLAFKSLSFFPFVYFVGRLMDMHTVNLTKYFHYICLVTIFAAIVLLGEVIFDQHLQTLTGYADFNFYFFGQEPSGNYGLSWTFETATGIKRFGSFFGGPLELGANTLFSVSILIALATKDDNKIQLNWFLLIAGIMTLICIVFAFSRAAFASYFIIIYIYLLITKRKKVLSIFYYSMLAFALFVVFLLSGDIYEFIITTINFTDPSSAYHVFQWIDGIEAIAQKPLGLGLGMSGRVSAETSSNIGGENQFLIIGVQTGILAMLIYVLIYIATINTAIKTFMQSAGKERKLALVLLLIKTGLIIPLLTANVESYIYIAYITWFLTGLLVQMVQTPKESTSTLSDAAK
jgi:O-antigen ligase